MGRGGCFAAPPAPLLGEPVRVGFDVPERAVRVPAHGGAIRAALAPGAHDLCAIRLLDGHEVAFGAPTRAGRRYFISTAVSFTFLLDDDAPIDLAAVTATSYPGVATIVAGHPEVVPMATPGQALKTGKYGVWTDAGRHAVVALEAPEGLRFVLADEGDGMVRTNIFTPTLSTVATLVGTVGRSS